MICLYKFVKSSDIDSIMEHGLASPVGISKSKEILDGIYDKKEDADSFLSKVDESDVTNFGISIFFQRPPYISEILKKDPKHLLSEDKYSLIKIDYSGLSSDQDVEIFGLELIKYEDHEYEDLKDEIERKLSKEEIVILSEKSNDEVWSEYEPMDGYFAPNVPHGSLVVTGDIIDPKYLDVIPTSYMDLTEEQREEIEDRKSRNKDFKIDDFEFAYHGSSHKLELVRPTPSFLFEDKPVVFATPNRDMALVFLSKWTDDDIYLGSENSGDLEIKELKEGAFDRLFKGKFGYIYKLKCDNFKNFPQLMKEEVVSFENEEIIEVEYIEDILYELNKSKVVMYHYNNYNNTTLIRKGKLLKFYVLSCYGFGSNTANYVL